MQKELQEGLDRYFHPIGNHVTRSRPLDETLRSYFLVAERQNIVGFVRTPREVFHVYSLILWSETISGYSVALMAERAWARMGIGLVNVACYFQRLVFHKRQAAGA